MTDMIKILMVDDEEQFRATTRKILTRRGFEVILAASGEEAIDKLKEKPDVVVLDLKMPGMDGLTALAEIKKRSADTPVIMLTGHGSEPSARTARDEEAFDYLTKPCDIDILTSKIKEAARQTGTDQPGERSVGEVMIPLEEYTTMSAEATVREAIAELRKSFEVKASSGRVMETGHRSIMITDRQGDVIGMLAILDLLSAIMPAYLQAPKPSMADSIKYSPMFWTGMFTAETLDLGQRTLEEIMSPAPPTVRSRASLMEATYLMAMNQERRLAVTRAGRVVGVIREQELFFEMASILK